METNTSRHVRLVEEVRHRIDRLVDAIQRIATTKRRMQSSITEAKSQIHSSVFSQLSAIRSREAWLLAEVDKQCQVKVDTLTRQSDTLQQSLGHLRGLLQVSTSREDSDGSVDSQIVQVLESTSGEALQPVKTLGLRFKVDNVAMLRAIQNYGCVDADGMPFDAFVHPDSSSESLPRAVEEYDDASHHVLYKTVAEIHDSDNKTIQVAMPRLHPQAGDWLCTPSEPCGQQPADHSAFSWNIPSSISQLSDSASSGSLHRWLLDIQNDADNDGNDDGFELITHSGDQSGESSNNQTSDVAVQSPATFSVFQEVADSPSSSWLQNAAPDERTPDVQSRLCEDRLKGEETCGITTGYPDQVHATDSTTDWIHVASPLRHPALRNPPSDVTSSSEASSVDGRERDPAETVSEVTATSPPLDRTTHSPTPELLYFRHFSVITDSPSSDWLQHGRALAATTSLSSWQHEMLKLKNSDWLMPANCSKEIPALS